MPTGTVKERLLTLETRLDSLQHQFDARLIQTPPKPRRGWKAVIGTFADDPLYDEAMRRGREWRENQHDETETP